MTTFLTNPALFFLTAIFLIWLVNLEPERRFRGDTA